MTTYEALNLVIQAALLCAVVCYAAETQKMRKTMFDQLEAPARPHVTVAAISDKTPDARIESAFSGESIPTVIDYAIDLYNGGQGTAFNLRVQVLNSTGTAILDQKFPPLDAYAWLLKVSIAHALDKQGAAVECTFESINGVRYWTRSEIADRHRIERSSFKVLGRSRGLICKTGRSFRGGFDQG